MYQLGLNTFAYHDENNTSSEDREITAFIWDPRGQKSGPLFYTHIGEGIFHLKVFLSYEGPYTIQVHENGEHRKTFIIHVADYKKSGFRSFLGDNVINT